MSITDNTNTLRLILDKTNNLPNSSGGAGGGSVQTATGSFTTSGNSNYIDVECGFTPDMLIVYLPDEYSVYGEFCKNDVGIDLTGVTLEDERVQGVGMFGTEDSDVMDITLSLVNVKTHSSGFYITAVYEQDLTGDWWFSNGKTYRYKAIKFDGGVPDVPQGNGWTSGVPYDHLTSLVANCYIESNGVQTAYNGWSATDYLPCDGVEDIVIDFKYADYEEYESKNYNAFYDENKQFIRSFSFTSNRTSETVSICEYNNMVIPANAKYVRFSHVSERMQQMFIFTPIG